MGRCVDVLITTNMSVSPGLQTKSPEVYWLRDRVHSQLLLPPNWRICWWRELRKSHEKLHAPTAAHCHWVHFPKGEFAGSASSENSCKDCVRLQRRTSNGFYRTCPSQPPISEPSVNAVSFVGQITGGNFGANHRRFKTPTPRKFKGEKKPPNIRRTSDNKLTIILLFKELSIYCQNFWELPPRPDKI
jgi:hypothetical protein